MADEQENIKLNFDTNAKQAAGDVNKLSISIDQTTESTEQNNNEVKKGADAFKNYKTQIREAKEEQQKLAQQYGATSEQALKAAQRVADLNDELGFQNDLVENLNPDQKFKALGAATQVAATGIQGVTAGMALFGDQSEGTEKLLLKVQSAMAFSDAISGLSDLSDQWALLQTTITSNSLAQKANTAATGAAAIVQNIFTGSVTTTTAGFKALKFAIAATGIGLLVVGLVAVYQNFDKIAKFATKLVPGLEGIGDAVMSIVNAVTDFIGITSEADRAADKLKSNAEKRSKDIDRILKEDGSRYSESAKKKMAIDKQLQDDLAAGIYNEQKLRKEAAFAIAKIDEDNAENARKKQKEEAEKAAEAQEKINEAALKKQQEAAKKRLDAHVKELQEFNTQSEEIAAASAHLLQKQEDDKKAKADKEEEDRKAKLANEFDRISKSAENQKSIDEAVLKHKEENQQRTVELGEQFIEGVKSIAGKNKAIQKAAIVAEGGVSIGKTIANTAEAIGKDSAKGFPFSIPLIALDAAIGATSIASIVSGTNKALQAVGGGSISGSSGASSSRGSSAPQVAFNNTSENQIGQSVARTQAEQPALQVTVLESDITKSQNNVKVLEKTNTF